MNPSSSPCLLWSWPELWTHRGWQGCLKGHRHWASGDFVGRWVAGWQREEGLFVSHSESLGSFWWAKNSQCMSYRCEFLSWCWEFTETQRKSGTNYHVYKGILIYGYIYACTTQINARAHRRLWKGGQLGSSTEKEKKVEAENLSTEGHVDIGTCSFLDSSNEPRRNVAGLSSQLRLQVQ